MNRIRLGKLWILLAVFCGADALDAQAQTPVPGTRYCLKNSSVANSVMFEINGNLSLASNGKVKSELFGSSDPDVQRAEARLASVDPGDTFGFGFEMSGVNSARGTKLWQIIGQPFDRGNPLAMGVDYNGNLVIEQKGGKLRGTSNLGSISGTHSWYFKIHAARNGNIEVYRDGRFVTSYHGDINFGQTGSRLRLGRYNRHTGGAAVAYFDNIYLDGKKPVTQYSTGSCR